MSSSRGKLPLNTKAYVLGSEAFASISAVEGLHLSAASRRRLDKLKAAGLTHEEMRAAILRAYKTSSGQE